MKPFAPPKRKIYEILILPVLLGIFYLFYPNANALAFFATGYIWNWSASVDMNLILENKRYKMSLINLVIRVQGLILKPFVKAPRFIQKILQVLPAGIFLGIVTFFNSSHMPWWSTFIGSLIFELVSLEIEFIKKNKEIS